MSILKGYAVIATIGESEEGKGMLSTNSTLDLSIETEDVTTKDDVSNGVLYPKNEVKYKKATLSCDGFQDSAKDSLDNTDIGDEVAVTFAFGKRTYSFTGRVTSLNLKGDMNSAAGYTINIESTGAITKSVTTGA